MSGLRVAVRPRGLELGALTLSGQRNPSGLTVEVHFAAENRGYREETVTPVVLFDPVLGGPQVEALGPIISLNLGERLDVRFQVSPPLASNGLFFARVQLVSEDGVNLGHSRFPAALEVAPAGATQR